MRRNKENSPLPPLLRQAWIRALTIAYCTVLAVSPVTAHAEEGYDRVAGSSSMGKTSEKLAPYGMTPVSGDMIEDGEYVVGVECSSSFFHIEEARLTVKEGKMTALLTMSSSSYLLVYPGTAQEAAGAPYEDYIESVDREGWDTFTIPVKALDMELDLAAYSKRKKMWYPRKVLLHASDIPAEDLRFDYPDYGRISQALALYEGQGGTEDAGNPDPSGEIKQDTEAKPVPETEAGTKPETEAETKPETKTEDGGANGPEAVRVDLADGEYSIEADLAGGSGRASVTSPTWLTIRDGKACVRLLWSSPYYDYMILEGQKYLNETRDGGNSTFTIPVETMDTPVEVIADTTAMGDPVEIAYTLTFYSDTIGSRSRVPQEGARRVLTGAVLFIVIGGIANHFVKKRRRV